MARVFINNVDSYTGEQLAKIFSNTVVGSTVEEAVDDDEVSQRAQVKYEVVGTLSDRTAAKPSCVTEIVEAKNVDDLLTALIQCDVVVYDVSTSESEVEDCLLACNALHEQIANFKSPKTFICLSSVMTWCKTKPNEPVRLMEPEQPFTEEDYRRRKPHPNFKSEINVEKQVIKLGKTDKTRFLTYVVAAGLPYGGKEDIFHYFFKVAWHGDTEALNIIGTGENIIPSIHVQDLSNIVTSVADAKPKTRYIVAVDDSMNSMTDIITCISKNLGTGNVMNITREEALLIPEISQRVFDILSVNLRMEGTWIKEGAKFEWVSETGILENITTVVDEYKRSRGLLPIRLCVMGPPAAGKSLIASQLCQHYKLHHLKIADVIQQSIEKLEKQAARAESEEGEEDDESAQQAQETLDLLNESKQENNDRYEDQYIIQFFTEKLLSMPCQNQGFVMDGFPKTYSQAKELFGNKEEAEDEDAPRLEFNSKIMPEVVISLDAEDDFLKKRIMNLPESVVAGTHNTEDLFLKRLAEFRAINTDDQTVLNYFDELEVHPEHLNIAADTSSNMSQVMEKIVKTVGKPRNYGPTQEEQLELERLGMEKKIKKEALEKLELQRKEEEEKKETQRRKEEWATRVKEVKEQEEEVLQAQSYPLRNYLMKHVMPTLNQGLIEVCKVRPEDAIDYLAEYLFEHNPQVD
ncbi:adenylate kinase 7-like isoform X3 [Bolinopsis microptera]|uniref:adenylate kinase 7-like isoform X3 n=1 Tax=Bolinopsis microptera TaxID=2820187 RepID=UPI00307A2408